MLMNIKDEHDNVVVVVDADAVVNDVKKQIANSKL